MNLVQGEPADPDTYYHSVRSSMCLFNTRHVNKQAGSSSVMQGMYIQYRWQRTGVWSQVCFRAGLIKMLTCREQPALFGQRASDADRPTHVLLPGVSTQDNDSPTIARVGWWVISVAVDAPFPSHHLRGTKSSLPRS